MPGDHTLFLGSPSKGYFTVGGPQGSRVMFKKNDLGGPEGHGNGSRSNSGWN